MEIHLIKLTRVMKCLNKSPVLKCVTSSKICFHVFPVLLRPTRRKFRTDSEPCVDVPILLYFISGLSCPPLDREKSIPAFLEWVSKHGVDTSAVEITSFPDCGYGLQATKDLKVRIRALIQFVLYQ